ncbi:hypothetical protein [Qipengyuania nanhaisediminis]|uniref:hypothetical protein n=1 Tax=Qipengyuania nanhaisediminis TaxID=604088 RepID=UPI0038B3FDE1
MKKTFLIAAPLSLALAACGSGDPAMEAEAEQIDEQAEALEEAADEAPTEAQEEALEEQAEVLEDTADEM